MSRKPRLFVAGGFFHVTLRGNNRGDIFFEYSDRERWQSLLQKGLDRYGHRLHAYCWMTNHVHMLLQVGEEPLSNFVRTLASTYARLVNARYGRVGHLFERRYRASMIQDNPYLLEVIRYIHLNPVSASIVESPNDYPWSSHHVYIGRATLPWVTTKHVLGCFGARRDAARSEYLRFIRTEVPPSFSKVVEHLDRISPSDDQLIGDDAWKADMLKGHKPRRRPGSLDELVAQACEKHQVTEDQLRSRSRCRVHSAIRAEIALAAVDEGVATITEVAHRFGRAHSGLSRAVNRLRDQQQ